MPLSAPIKYNEMEWNVSSLEKISRSRRRRCFRCTKRKLSISFNFFEHSQFILLFFCNKTSSQQPGTLGYALPSNKKNCALPSNDRRQAAATNSARKFPKEFARSAVAAAHKFFGRQFQHHIFGAMMGKPHKSRVKFVSIFNPFPLLFV